ncbi:MAG: hypothetical protein RIE77_04080 [Phycisphaerales bacterium]
MPVQPRKKVENIEFFEQRAPIWEANAATLNLTTEETAQLTSLTGTARTRYTEAQLKAEQSKTATANQDIAIQAMRDLGADLIKKIRVAAEQTGNPELFTLAQIPEPKDPASIPPVDASDVAFDLLNDGSLELTWKGSVSTGTTYIVRRAITPTGGNQQAYQDIAFADGKRFVDSTIPAGTERASYVVRAKKGETVTPGTVPITVRFAIGGNGQLEAKAA